ncbi:uncharacterized protein OCT59_019872 [Rhizophagus irregularis]|uniref:uncharacterized protein n=1 Tax=Rhizophagus irregularis TaxID=588596 RepID=UPI001C18BD9E|nr:hypothetical protein OCT59_019872 [Rhizophagus irregularis]CAB5187300.1 unnamed protein product [Rhizophagus irregularis]CAB5346095.1 unnamed protein product [Rhizophagus irregularis]
MPPKKDTTKDTRASKSKEISETNEANETSETNETTKRAPTAYNRFMKTELPKVKAENPARTIQRIKPVKDISALLLNSIIGYNL